jgi:hypothetical protein
MSADGGSGHVTPSPAAPTKSPAGRTAYEGASGIKPNEAKRNKPVLLTVISASNVYGIDGKFNPRASWTSDCYVKVTCDCAFVNEKKDGAQQTQPIRENNNPVWHKPSGRTNNHENFVLKFEPSAISDSGSQPTLEVHGVCMPQLFSASFVHLLVALSHLSVPLSVRRLCDSILAC